MFSSYFSLGDVNSLAAWHDPLNHFEHVTNKNSIKFNPINPFHDEMGMLIPQDDLRYKIRSGVYVAAEVIFKM